MNKSHRYSHAQQGLQEAVLVTGANGFIGRAVCAHLQAAGMQVRGAIRTKSVLHDGVQTVFVPNIDEKTSWTHALTGCSTLVHCAARVHVMAETADKSLSEFRRVNVQGTLNLAHQAASVGVRRFVYMSSIGVNGAVTFEKSFTTRDLEAPHSPYAVSKYEAEQGLQKLAAETGMEVVIIRPPLAYGPNPPGNFGSLMRWLKRGFPLPLGAIHNQRSLVSLGNLVDLIFICLIHPAAANQTFMVSDGEDVSTTDLLRRMGKAMGHPACLVPFPETLLRVGAGLLGKADIAQRLCGSLQIDISETRELLGWTPPLTLDEGLEQAALGFKR